MEGFEVAPIEDTLGRGDIYVTCTGNVDIITLEHMKAMKDQAIVCNIGHFDNEIQMDKLNQAPGVKKINIKPQVDQYNFCLLYTSGAKSLAEMQGRIRAAAEKAPAGQWLSGGGWDHTLWAGAKLPDRADVDGAAEGHPAIFTRVDGHIAIADSAALATANVTGHTPDPPGGKIDRDAGGNPTGILRETCLLYTSRCV